MSDASGNNLEPIYVRFLPKLGSYLVGITLLCYMAGFAITNLYLGSLGIVNLDILRARYVLAGLLFLLFLGAIAFLIYGLIHTLRRHAQKPPILLLLRVIWYSLLNISIIYWAVPAVALFAGSLGNAPPAVPQLTSQLPISDWLATAPSNVFRQSLALYGILLFSTIITITIFIVINPKDKNGIRTPRRQILREAFRKMKQEKKTLFGSLLGGFLFLYAMFLISSLLTFMAVNRISDTSIKITSMMPEEWTRYFGAIVVIYALAVCI